MDMCPEGWEVVKAGECVKVIRGVSYKDSDVHYARQNNDCMILRGGNIIDGENINVTVDDNVYINRSLISESQLVRKNDVVIVASTASMKVIGKSGFVEKDYKNIAPGAFLLLIRPIPSEKIFAPYIALYFRTNLYRKNIKHLVAGGVIQNIRRDYITNMLIPLPPLPEQQAIADTLTVFDTHITNLANLIAKKKAIRDGALDDLMSARTRLKGFSGQWEVKKLGEILKILHGKSQEGVASSRGKYPIMGSGGVIGKAEKYLCDWECVLIGRKGTIDRPYYMNEPFWCIDTIYYSKPAENQCVKYQYYLFRTIRWYNYMETSGRPSLTREAIENITVRVPPLPEQQAISDTLTAFDDEINALESERAKIIQIRDGAMNDLLTGKVRLLHHGK